MSPITLKWLFPWIRPNEVKVRCELEQAFGAVSNMEFVQVNQFGALANLPNQLILVKRTVTSYWYQD